MAIEKLWSIIFATTNLKANSIWHICVPPCRLAKMAVHSSNDFVTILSRKKLLAWYRLTSQSFPSWTLVWKTPQIKTRPSQTEFVWSSAKKKKKHHDVHTEARSFKAVYVKDFPDQKASTIVAVKGPLSYHVELLGSSMLAVKSDTATPGDPPTETPASSAWRTGMVFPCST